MRNLEPSAPRNSTPPELSVVLPAYLEEDNLRLLLPRVAAVLETIGITAEVIVVDSSVPMDATADVASACGARAVAREGGNSYGDAVRTGIAKARGEWVIFMDADGSHPPEWIAKLCAARDSHDLVIASRYIDHGFTENSWSLVLMSRVLNWTYSAALGIRVKDVSNSFRLYRGAQLRALKLSCSNFDIVEEVLIKLLQAHPGLQIIEIPFTFKKRMFGDSKRNLVLFTLGYVFTLLKLRFFVDIGDQLLRFCLVGAAGTVVNLSVFTLGVRWLGADPNIAATVAFVVAVTENFALNRIWTFRRETAAIAREGAWIKYVLVNLLGFGINLLVLNAVLLIWGSERGMLGQALGIMAGMASNFAMSRHFVFRASSRAKRRAESKHAPIV
jgi:dolichol-phosphate mannosyltransferase